MAFTMLNADMSIIQKLADNPTETAAELKAKFDEGGEAVKEYLNSVHLPELEAEVTGLKGDISGLETAVGEIPAVIDNLTSTSGDRRAVGQPGESAEHGAGGQAEDDHGGHGQPERRRGRGRLYQIRVTG